MEKSDRQRSKRPYCRLGKKLRKPRNSEVAIPSLRSPVGVRSRNVYESNHLSRDLLQPLQPARSFWRHRCQPDTSRRHGSLVPNLQLLTLVPKLQLGDPVPQSSASSPGSGSFPQVRSQAGAWERAAKPEFGNERRKLSQRRHQPSLRACGVDPKRRPPQRGPRRPPPPAPTARSLARAGSNPRSGSPRPTDRPPAGH